MAVKLYTPDANVIVHETKVDFRRRVVQRQINLVQYDKSMPVIAVQLCSNGNEYVLPENASAYIRFGKRDHTYVYNECLGCDQTRTIVYFAITDQMTVFYGEHTPIVELRIGDTVAGSGSIPIWIDRNPIQNGDTESKSDLSVFEKAIEAAKKITDLGIGKSVPPTLILTDLSGDEPVTKSFLTEEEKTNLEKGLYNQVFYIDTSIGMPNMYFSNYFPEIYNAEAGGFFIYAGTLDTKAGENLPTVNPTHIYGYNIEIAEKDSSGNYPITITRAIELPLSRQGGGGASVSPMLNLMDMSGESPIVRTSITEEEKTNLEKGLYNSILYFNPSLDIDFYSSYFPETAISVTEGTFTFSKYNFSVDETTQKVTVSSSSVYGLSIGEKSADGTYPIAIEEMLKAPFGGGGGSSTSIAFQDVTVSELANRVGEFGNFHITDLKLVYDSFFGPQEFTGGYFIGTVASSTALAGVMWVVVDTQSNRTAYYKSDNFSISNGKITLQQTETLGVIKSLPFPKKINSQDGYNFLSEVIDTGSIVYAGEADIDSSSISHLILGLSSNVVPTATGDEEYCHFDCIVEEKGIGRLSLKKDSNNIPQFKSFTTWLPPVTSADEGKALIVADGNAKWTTTPRYEHTITIKNSAGKILWTQTMRNSSNTVVNSYANLKTLFGEATYAGFGEYCQLNLEGGTEATDKLIKADGTEVTLASLGAIIYTDKCFLPK